MIAKEIHSAVDQGRGYINVLDVAYNIYGRAILLQEHRTVGAILEMRLELHARLFIHVLLEIVDDELIHFLTRPRVAAHESSNPSENTHPISDVRPVWLDEV